MGVDPRCSASGDVEIGDARALGVLHHGMFSYVPFASPCAVGVQEVWVFVFAQHPPESVRLAWNRLALSWNRQGDGRRNDLRDLTPK